VRKLLTWGFLALVIFFVAFRPSEAAFIWNSIWDGIGAVWGGFQSTLGGVST
jgi:hypothetical protein